MTMSQRRTGTRIPLELAAKVTWKGRAGSVRQVQGKTENISGNGLFMAMPTRLRIDTPIIVTITIPARVTKVPLRLLCEGRVVRWSRAGELRGIAATIDDYDLRPQTR